MAVKNVALAEDAYDLLASQKRPGESFSDVVRRLAGRRSPLDFIGAWKDIPDAEVEAMKRTIKARKRSGDRKFRRKLARWKR